MTYDRAWTHQLFEKAPMPGYHVEALDSVSRLGRAGWNAVSGTENPFTRYEFLDALETRGCATASQGWQPHHIALQNTSGKAVALVPAWLKSHSMGEYVFDWGWADAYERHGLPYYPKLLCAVPFTPSVGPRILCSTNADAELQRAAAAAITAEARQHGLSSWHLLFPEPEVSAALTGTDDVLMRLGCQFRWRNHGYDEFSDFTDHLVSRKRKMIRKERQVVVDQGIRFRHIEGVDISETDLQTFYIFYQATYLKRGQSPYLTLGFFRQLAETMPGQMHLVMAEHQGKDVAAALFFVNQTTLFGRYWGCLEEYDRLHFETCYYQGIDLCIARGLKEFDAGAQGEHKILRGFEPVITHSCHWIAHPSFRAAIADFVEAEAQQIESYVEEARSLLPFRKDSDPADQPGLS